MLNNVFKVSEHGSCRLSIENQNQYSKTDFALFENWLGL